MMSNFGQRPQFKLIIQLFYEGKTELDYLQKFISQQHKNAVVKLNKIKHNHNPRILAQEAVNQCDDLKMDLSEVWVAFDDDGRDAEVKEAIDLINNSGKDIHIAFMKPCIEIWPLMHNGINNVTTQAMAQSKLKNIMPSYKHDRNPYFDLNKMPDYEGAVAKAKQWQTSLSGAPEYDSTKFAGIYKLTEKIKGA
jgi:hypothetical protein